MSRVARSTGTRARACRGAANGQFVVLPGAARRGALIGVLAVSGLLSCLSDEPSVASAPDVGPVEDEVGFVVAQIPPASVPSTAEVGEQADPRDRAGRPATSAHSEAAPLSPPLGSAWPASREEGFSFFPGGHVEWGGQHLVLEHAFDMQRHEVTQRQFVELMGSMPAGNRYCPECPVAYVSWQDAMEFANRWSDMRGLERCWPGGDDRPPIDPYACEGYRLPTALEWGRVFELEYGGQWTDGDAVYGECRLDTALAEVAWYCANSGGRTHPVGQRAGTERGMHDLLGNVSEWLWDARGCAGVDPDFGYCPTPREGWMRVPGFGGQVTHQGSGGDFASAPDEVGKRTGRSSLHGWGDPESPGMATVGFRLVRTRNPRR